MLKYIGVAVVLLVIGVASTAGAVWFFRSTQYTNVGTFQQCQSAGGLIQESFPPVCVLPNGQRFVAPPTQEAETPLTAREQRQQELALEGMQIAYNDGARLAAIFPKDWKVLLGNPASATESTQDSIPALTIGPDSLSARERVVTIMLPVKIAGPHHDRGVMFAQGLAGLSQRPEIMSLSSEIYPQNQIKPLQVAGRSAMQWELVTASTLPANYSSFCAGCVKRTYFIETPQQEIIEITAQWPQSDTAFSQAYDSVVKRIEWLTE